MTTMIPSPPPKPLSRVEEWILLFLVDREKSGRITKGNDFWLLASDVEPLVEREFVALSQSHVIPSLQKKIMPTTVVSLTEKGRHYFER
jgi:hypothetical protein